MEEKKVFLGIQWKYPLVGEELEKAKRRMLKNDAPELLVYRESEDAHYSYALMLDKYYDESVMDGLYVEYSVQEGDFRRSVIPTTLVRSFLMRAIRRLDTSASKQQTEKQEASDPLDLEIPVADTPETFDSLLDIPLGEEPAEPPMSPEERFLRTHTPESIARELDTEVIGQPQLTRAAADFLYYHILRQVHPELPPRPMLISGPSGSGKTEVWRVIQKKYGELLNVRIMDGSNLSCEGWSGNYKLETYIDSRLADGGILVVDEFDKLTSPRFSNGGNNVSLDMQSEFLKLMEGEYQLSRNKHLTGVTSRKMGVVLVGAFERLRNDPEEACKSNPIGFGAQEEKSEKLPLTDEDFIRSGVMPEIVGRIAVKCETNYLTDDVYIDIINSPNSRVAVLRSVLQSYGVNVDQIFSREELTKLISTSRSNRTGVRWVVSQVETRMLESIREQGLYRDPPAPKAQGREPIPA